MTYAVISSLRSLARWLSPGLSLASGFEHPASTIPTRFPAALGIGHGPACGLANACALVYVAAYACSAIQVTTMSWRCPLPMPCKGA